MRSWIKWLPFLLLNIIISAATTLTVLYFWNRSHPTQAINIQIPQQATLQENSSPSIQSTLPPLDEEWINITSVIAPGDLAYEFVVLQKTGVDMLDLTGWQLTDDDGNVFTFPEFKIFQGDFQVYSKNGENSVTRLYWDANEPIWQEGESVHLLDYAGQERATYQVP